jgi:hypothetical protein
MHLSDAPISFFFKTIKRHHLNSPATPSAFPPMLRPTKPYVPRLGGDVMIFFNDTLSSPFFAGRLSYSVKYFPGNCQLLCQRTLRTPCTRPAMLQRSPVLAQENAE